MVLNVHVAAVVRVVHQQLISHCVQIVAATHVRPFVVLCVSSKAPQSALVSTDITVVLSSLCLPQLLLLLFLFLFSFFFLLVKAPRKRPLLVMSLPFLLRPSPRGPAGSG